MVLAGSLRITKVIKSQPPTYYPTEENTGEKVIGAVYQLELIPVVEERLLTKGIGYILLKKFRAFEIIWASRIKSKD